MDSRIELHANGKWIPAAVLAVEGGRLRFEYLPEYVFSASAPQPVALGLPVGMEIASARMDQPRTPLAFAWDLVPQGKGRQHLASLLGVSGDAPELDLFLAQHGAFAPIGRLRLDTAVRFYEAQVHGQVAAGFARRDIADRSDAFLDQLTLHSMLSAGTPGVQGVAPKFLLTEDHDGRWFPDVALPDERAARHWIVKLPRGRLPVDRAILRHEAVYLRVAAACGLRSIPDAHCENDMLFLPRFDRRVEAGGVVRLHQETFASLIGATGFGRSASLFELVAQLAGVATDAAAEVAEFLCRDSFNRALRNPDNHLRNSSVQQLPDGTVQLTPLYDVGPMYQDPEFITRTCEWRNEEGRVVEGWPAIAAGLPLDAAATRAATLALRRFGEAQLPRIAGLLLEHGADPALVEACRPSIDAQIAQLQALVP